MLCAPGFFSSRYAPNPRPSWPANSGVNSVFTRPRTSYSRKTCRGMAMSRGIYARDCGRTSSSEDERQEGAGDEKGRAAEQGGGGDLAFRFRVRLEVRVAGGEPFRRGLCFSILRRGGGR